jgi:hypothetical protein
VKGAEGFVTQAEAIERALLLAETHGGTVHVFSGPEGGDCGEGEVVCGPPFAPELPAPVERPARVVFHPEVAVLAGGGWACLSCGREGGTGDVAPARPTLRS